MIGTTVSTSMLQLDDSRCQACQRCLAQQVCKTRAIVRIDLDEPPFIDVHRCRGCKVCLGECPWDAIITS